MLLDVRTYICRPNTMKKHLELYAAKGKGPQIRHLGEPIVFATGETGNPNEYLHIWAYENAADRERRRAAMWSDPEWLAYVEESNKLAALESQSTRLMVTVGFVKPPR